MSIYFKENGFLTPEGEMLLVTFKGAIESLFDSFEVQDMMESEIRVLGSVMTNMVGNTVSKHVSAQKQDSGRFAEMTDEQFDAYLKEKYGSLWMCAALSEEELARCPILSKTEIRGAIEEGMRDSMPDSPMMQVDPRLRF